MRCTQGLPLLGQGGVLILCYHCHKDQFVCPKFGQLQRIDDQIFQNKRCEHCGGIGGMNMRFDPDMDRFDLSQDEKDILEHIFVFKALEVCMGNKVEYNQSNHVISTRNHAYFDYECGTGITPEAVIQFLRGSLLGQMVTNFVNSQQVEVSYHLRCAPQEIIDKTNKVMDHYRKLRLDGVKWESEGF